MEYLFFESVDRYEITTEDITLKRYENFNPDNNTRPERINLRETGSSVTARYFLQGKYETDTKLSAEQIFAINNVIRAFMLLKGEKSVDEQLIAKFIKKKTGVKVKNLTIKLATKTFTYSYRAGGKYQSDTIDLVSHATKNI